MANENDAYLNDPEPTLNLGEELPFAEAAEGAESAENADAAAATYQPLTPKISPFRTDFRPPPSSVPSHAAGREAEPANDADAGVSRQIGTALRQARESQGLTAAQVSQKTRIPADFINKIEADRLDALPPPVYSKSYIRQLAREYGLDEETLLDEYLAFLKDESDHTNLPAADQARLQVGESAPEPEKPRRNGLLNGKRPTPAMLAVVGVLLVLLLLVIGVAVFKPGKAAKTTENPLAAPVANSATAVPPPPATAPAKTGTEIRFEEMIVPEELPVKELALPGT